MKMYNTNKGFTLVEIIVVCAVVAVFMISAIMLFSNFRKGYSRSESSAILLQEGAIFLARLRTDLNNAIIIPGAAKNSFNEQLHISPDQLKFSSYDSNTGSALPIIYYYRKSANGGSISRKISDKKERKLISNDVSKLSWNMVVEKFTGKASGTTRVGIHLKLELVDRKKKNKIFLLETRIFPARLNRQFNEI